MVDRPSVAIGVDEERSDASTATATCDPAGTETIEVRFRIADDLLSYMVTKGYNERLGAREVLRLKDSMIKTAMTEFRLKLILAGILGVERDVVVEAAASNDFALDGEAREGEWWAGAFTLQTE